MASPSLSRVVLRNVLVAVLLSVPSALVTFAGVTAIVGVDDGASLLDLSVLFPWLSFLAAIGAVLFTLGLEVARRRGMVLTRSRALLFAPLLLVPWVIVPARGLLIYPAFLVGVVVGIVVLVAGARLPRTLEEGGS